MIGFCSIEEFSFWISIEFQSICDRTSMKLRFNLARFLIMTSNNEVKCDEYSCRSDTIVPSDSYNHTHSIHLSRASDLHWLFKLRQLGQEVTRHHSRQSHNNYKHNTWPPYQLWESEKERQRERAKQAIQIEFKMCGCVFIDGRVWVCVNCPIVKHGFFLGRWVEHSLACFLLFFSNQLIMWFILFSLFMNLFASLSSAISPFLL